MKWWDEEEVKKMMRWNDKIAEVALVFFGLVFAVMLLNWIFGY